MGSGSETLMERLSFGGILSEEGTGSILKSKDSHENESEKTRKNKKAFLGTLMAFNAIALLAIGYLLVATKGTSVFGSSSAVVNGIELRWVLVPFLLIASIFMFIHIDYIFKKNNHCTTEPKKLYNQTFAGLFLIIFAIFALSCSFIYPFDTEKNRGSANTFIAAYFLLVIIGVGLTLDAMNLKKCKESDKELKSFRDVSITGIVFQLLSALITIGTAIMANGVGSGGESSYKPPHFVANSGNSGNSSNSSRDMSTASGGQSSSYKPPHPVANRS